MKKINNAFLIGMMALLGLGSCKKNENEATGTISSIIDVNYIKKLHNGDDVSLVKEKLMGATQIAGVVISDVDNGNFAKNELVIQNFYKGRIAGIIVRFDNNSDSFKLGDSVKVEINNTVLTRKNGSLIIKGLDFSKVTKISSGNMITTRVVTLSQLYGDFFNYESTLVKINNVGFAEAHVNETFEGSKDLNDNTGGKIILSTSAEASFSDLLLPLNASLTGIATYYHPSKDNYTVADNLVKMRNTNDLSNISGVAYTNFPENFENVPAANKAVYDMPLINNTVTFKTGNWKIYQGVIGNEINKDKFNPLGKQAIRLQGNLSESAVLEMGFDLMSGASKVTLVYGTYENDLSSTWSLEYSQDGGATWLQSGQVVKDAKISPKSATFILNIVGKVRFRINKHGLGLSDYPLIENGRLNIDDFTVYQNI
ncbi:hypothetical protein FBD94_24695 [Pedobacter hiemivivus]|uniref:DUF5689 domain-containing protein n=1 Tax=Pedobacter hiemivivus TaxID=2530454 RepID=A0A4U1FYG2_9SPHI|nr:DUF5689 domain-containing protein [Pedobacter hiemivivus]TKC55559.1 hypothetical protein FBD94_24695 [Pedobacter hiemivivus]